MSSDSEEEQVFKNLSELCNSESPKRSLFPQVNLSVIATQIHLFIPQFDIDSFSIYQFSKLTERLLKRESKEGRAEADLSDCMYTVAELLHQDPLDPKTSTTMVEEFYILKEQRRELKVAKKRLKAGKRVKLLTAEELDFLTKPELTFEEEEALMKAEYQREQEERNKELEQYERALANGETPQALTHELLNEDEWKTKWFDEMNKKKRKEELQRKRLIYRFSSQPTLKQVKEKLSLVKEQLSDLERKITEYVGTRWDDEM